MYETGSGAIGLITALLIFAWAIISIFAPFFWYGTWYRSKQIDIKLEETNALLRRIAAGSTEFASAPASASVTANPGDPADGYILASEYAAAHNLETSAVIDQITQKRLDGKPINGSWHVKAP